MLLNSEAVKKAKKLQQQGRWEEALASWRGLAKEDEDYAFQVEACRIIAETRKMSEEIPVRSADCIMIVNGKQTSEQKFFEDKSNEQK